MTPPPSITSAAELAAHLAQRCEQATQRGESWQACCPAHRDSHPSLTITPRGTQVLIHCHAGCATTAIVAALGLQMRDLFVSSGRPSPRAPGAKRITKVYDYV